MTNSDIIDEIVYLNKEIKKCQETMLICNQRKEHLYKVFSRSNNTEFNNLNSLQFFNNKKEIR